MPRPRYTQISHDATAYYHCVSRCVRRAYLCGTDVLTGQCYEHRRQWVEDKLIAIGRIFAIDICAYAIMSNHYHVVLHINKTQALSWSQDEVIQAWHQLFSGNLLSKRYVKGETLGKAELAVLKQSIKIWRQRLMDISWFMRVLNEHIARQANEEDDCSGRFWEGRFKSQALLDEAALLACMAYVDLNPIRAGIATTPERSNHTSIQQRLQRGSKVTALFAFAGNPAKGKTQGIPFRFSDYLQLVDWSGRIIRDDKRGFIPENIPPILQRFNREPRNWLYLMQHFESKLSGLVGAVNKLRRVCKKMGYQRTPCLRSCQQYFS